MSLFKNEFPQLSRQASVASTVPNASGAGNEPSSFNLIPTQYVVPIFAGQSTVSATIANNCFFIADDYYQIASIREVHDTASSSGTVDVKKAGSGVAVGSAVSVLASTISTASTAATPQSAALSTTLATIQLVPGDRLYFLGGGTQTSLAGSTAFLYLKRVQ